MSKTIALITGISSGLGRAFAKELLGNGYTVVGTARTSEAASEFESSSGGNAIARILDVTDYNAIRDAVDGVEREVGPIHVLINNAGYGHEGVLEESSIDELQQQFAVNVFGPVAMMKAVLPYMRQRHSGRIINVTSMGGLMTMPGLSYYHGSKFALEGISASLGKEVRALGVYVTAVEPGMFRTEWAGRSMVRSTRSISDYDGIFDPIRAARAARNGSQPGDPAKAAKALVKLIESENPPAHLLLGADALQFVGRELDQLQDEMARWETITRSTNFDDAPAKPV